MVEIRNNMKTGLMGNSYFLINPVLVITFHSNCGAGVLLHF